MSEPAFFDINTRDYQLCRLLCSRNNFTVKFYLCLFDCSKKLNRGSLLYIHLNFCVALALALLLLLIGLQTATRVRVSPTSFSSPSLSLSLPLGAVWCSSRPTPLPVPGCVLLDAVRGYYAVLARGESVRFSC